MEAVGAAWTLIALTTGIGTRFDQTDSVSGGRFVSDRPGRPPLGTERPQQGLASSCRPGVNCAESAHLSVGLPGTAGIDCSSIQAAVNCASHSVLTIASVVITVRAGEYREQICLNRSGVVLVGAGEMSSQPALHILPVSAVVVMWDVPNEHVINVAADDVTIANLTVTQPPPTPAHPVLCRSKAPGVGDSAFSLSGICW